MKPIALSIFLILFLASSVAAQAGGHTLFGDIKVDESQVNGSKPLSLYVLLYSESGELLLRQTVPINGRYRFLSLRDGRYDVVVEFENVEIAAGQSLCHFSVQNGFPSGHRTRIAR